MTKYVKDNSKFTFLKIMRITFFSLMFMSFFFTIYVGIEYLILNTSKDKMITMTGIVKSIEVEDEYYQIKIDKYNETFTISETLAKNLNAEVPSVGDEITISTLNSYIYDDEVQVLQIERNNTIIFDYCTFLINSYKKFGLIFSISILITMTGYILFKILDAKKSMDLVPSYEKIIKHKYHPNFSFYEDKYKSSFYYRDHRKAKRISFLMFLILLLGVHLAVEYIPDDNDNLIMGAVLLACGLFYLILFYRSLHSININFTKKKRLNDFLEDYHEYLNYSNDSTYDLYINYFEVDGINCSYTVDHIMKDIRIPYEKMNLHAVAWYNPSLMMMRIFICSNLDEEEFKDLPDEFVAELDGSLLKILQEKQVKVDGLDYILNNFEAETKKYLKKNIVISYKDYQ